MKFVTMALECAGADDTGIDIVTMLVVKNPNSYAAANDSLLRQRQYL